MAGLRNDRNAFFCQKYDLWVTPSRDHMQQTSRSGARQVSPSEGGRRKLFSEVLKDEETKGI